MREEEEPNWFSRWEEELPSPEELTPLSQTLITPDLALAFDIPSPNSASIHHRNTPPHPPPPIPPHSPSFQSQHHQVTTTTTPSSQQHQQQQQQADFDSLDMTSGGSALPGDDQARTLKRPRLVWTPQLHKRFVDAVAHLGIKNAVPKTIMQLMSVDGLTRENVASHLQKYRLYLKRMQGLSSAAGGGGGGGGGVGGPGPQPDATEQLFASGPVPQHFLNRGGPAGGGPEQFLPFMQVSALQQQQQQIAAAVVAHQQQYYHHRHMGHLASPTGGEFEHGFLSRQPQQQAGIHRMMGGGGVAVAVPASPPPSRPFSDGLDSDSAGGVCGRKVLTLFPTNDD